MLLHKGRIPLFRKDSACVSHASLCPSMDLIAFCNTESSTLVVFRSIDWEKLSPQNLGGASNCTGALAWRADGNTLAVGLEDGSIVLLGMEKLNVENDDMRRASEALPGAITALGWTSFRLPLPNPLEELSLASHRHVMNVNFASMKPSEICNELSKSAQLQPQQEEIEESDSGGAGKEVYLDCLVAADLLGNVSLQLLGEFSICEFQLPAHAIQVSLSPELLLVLDAEQCLHTYSFAYFSARLPLLQFTAQTFLDIEHEFAQMTSSLQLLKRLWEDLLLALKRLFSALIQEDSDTISKLLFTLLTMGPSPPELVQFARDLTPGLLDRAQVQIEQTMRAIVKLLQVEVTRAAESILERLGGGMLALQRELHEELGLSPNWLQSMISSGQVLLIQVQRTARVARESLRNLLALHSFLRSMQDRFAHGDRAQLAGLTEEDFALVLQTFCLGQELENPALSREFGVERSKRNVFSAAALKQSWDREYQAVEEEGGEADGGLAQVLSEVKTQWHMGRALITRALSTRLEIVHDSRCLPPSRCVLLAENSIVYSSETSGLVMEEFDCDACVWRQGDCDAALEQVDADAIAYCGHGSGGGKRAALEQGMFVVTARRTHPNELLVLGMEDGRLTICKSIPKRRCMAETRLVASGPRGVVCALTARGQFQMFDIVQEEEEAEEDNT